MPTNLSIQLSSPVKPDMFEINFFETEGLTMDTEKQLMARIQELLALLRDLAKSIRVTVAAEVTDYDRSVFLIGRRSHQTPQINSQKLSLREIEVLGLIMQGLTTLQIAAKLFISFETVRSHRKNILEKAGVKNTASLIKYFYQTFFEK